MIPSVHILVSRFGEVSEGKVRRVVRLMEECYRRLMPHEVELVDLYVFERSSSLNAFLTRELEEVGVGSARFDDFFFAMHDAWRGISRITLCFERMKELPKLVQDGGVRHEVGHSVLHGDLRHYLLPVPPALLELTQRFNLPREYVTNMLYLISMAVKDYEVSRLLTERGYVADQLAYAKHLLTVSEKDKLSWRISRGKPLAETLCLVSCLKALGCAVPFILDERFGKEVKRVLKESLSYLPKKHSVSLLDLVTEHFPSMGTDTLSNINYVTRLTVKKIIKPVLLKETS